MPKYGMALFSDGVWITADYECIMLFPKPSEDLDPEKRCKLANLQFRAAERTAEKLNAFDALLAACKKYLAWKEDKRAPIWDGAKAVEDIRAAVALAEPASQEPELPPARKES